MQRPPSDSAYWSSSTAFVIAAAGAAIGLGSIQRLPYLVAEYGGGAFLLVYGGALALMALPLLIAQLLLGRGARSAVPGIFRRWAAAAGGSPAWIGLGYLMLLGVVSVLSYYCVIAGWSLAYLVRAVAGTLDGPDAQSLRSQFFALVGDPEKVMGWQTLFLLAAGLCSARGLRRGVETSMRWLLLLAVLILLGLLLHVCLSGDMPALAARYFQLDFAALGWRGVFEAFRQAFFALSLGLGVMLAYGAYLRHGVSLWRAGTSVVALTLAFAVVSGFVVTAVLAGVGAGPTADLQLVFVAIPAAGSDVLGGWFGVLFFALIVLLGLTTAIGLLEPLVVWVGQRFGVNRVFAATCAAALVWVLGLGTALSFNLLAESQLYQRTFFSWLSLSASNLLLPAVGLLICVFAGGFLPGERLRAHWFGRGFGVWFWLLRYPARVGLLLVLLYCVGAVDAADALW